MDNKYNGGAMTNKNDLSSALCDAYDIKDRSVEMVKKTNQKTLTDLNNNR
jgi:hypothetical protein